MTNDAGSSLGKKKLSCFRAHYIFIIFYRVQTKTQNNSQYCCLFPHQGQLFTGNYTKVVGLFQGVQVPRPVADLGWQGNKIYTTL